MALPVNGSTHLIPAYYSFHRPRKDERLSWPCWLTYSGRFTHISGHPSAAGRAQDRESSLARDRRSTTVPRHQPTAVEVLQNPLIKKCSLTPSRIFIHSERLHPPPEGEQNIATSVSVCLSVRSHISDTTYPNFSKCPSYLWPWLTALRYVAHFRFCERRHICPQSARQFRRDWGPYSKRLTGGQRRRLMSTTALLGVGSRHLGFAGLRHVQH